MTIYPTSKVTPRSASFEFEVYVLMSMRLRIRMSQNEAALQAKLAENGLTIETAEHIYEQVVAALSDEASFFRDMAKLLNVESENVESLEYDSTMWPGFCFTATSSAGISLESAAYRHMQRDRFRGASPMQLPMWSVDIQEFGEHFGPLTVRGKWPPSDRLLPAYEEHEFEWAGEAYGAGFSWGLFMFAARMWD